MKTPPRVVVGTRRELEKAFQAMFSRVPPKSLIEDLSEIQFRVQAMPAKQERSVQTLNRLLDAAEHVLEEDGLEAATVPAIAKRAGVSVGVVYRRFKNKEALIRGVYERFLWRVGEQNSVLLAALSGMQIGIHDLLRGMIHGTIESNRRKRNLLRALLQFARTQKDPAIKEQAAKMNRASTAAFTALMLAQRDRIQHPDPEAAIEFAVLTVAAVIRSVIVGEHSHGLVPPSDLEDELIRMISGYLGLR